MKSLIRLRMSTQDAHYGGNLVDGARMLGLFGDVATELLIRNDGDEGLFVAYDNVEFLAPVYAGDYIEAEGEIVSQGNSSRKMCIRDRVLKKGSKKSALKADFLGKNCIFIPIIKFFFVYPWGQHRFRMPCKLPGALPKRRMPNRLCQAWVLSPFLLQRPFFLKSSLGILFLPLLRCNLRHLSLIHIS